MKPRLFAGVLGAFLMLLPLSAADTDKRKSQTDKQDSDMQRAIAFERYKDLAAARQAGIEAKHPTVFYNNADRQSDSEDQAGRKVVKDKK